MEREIDLQEISDGKLYTNKDMVKAGCGECQDVPTAVGDGKLDLSGSDGYLPADNGAGMFL